MGLELPQPFSGGGGGMSPSQQGMMMGGLGGIGAGIASFFTQNPADSAMPYLNQIPGMMQGYMNPFIQNGQSAWGQLNPYMQRGNQAGNMLMGQYGNLVNNPAGVMNQIGSTFQQSPGYGWQTSQALQAANRASAAGGMAGSPAEQQQIAGVTNQMANQDYYNYLSHAMGMYGQGLQGLQGMYGQGMGVGEDIYNTGYGAANDLSSNLASALMSQANLAYAGQQNQNQTMMGGMGSLASGLGAAGMAFGL